MAKFFKMVHNEFIKIFAKLSTKIFLLVILLVVILFNFMMYGQVNYVTGADGQIQTQITNEMEKYKNSQIIDDKINLEQMQFIRDNKLDELPNVTTWREEKTREIYNEKIRHVQNNKLNLPENVKKHHDNQLQFIKSNDSKGYCEYMLSWIKSEKGITKEEKDLQIWQYEYILKNNIYTADETVDGTWKSELFSNIIKQKATYEELNAKKSAGKEVDAQMFAESQKAYLTGIYRIEHNIKSVYEGASINNMGNTNAYWATAGNSTSLISIISLIIIIIAGAMISSEFSGGTIKFLLINPVSRGKILMSKYFCLISLSYIFIFALFIFNIIVSGLFFGFGQLDAVFLTVKDGVVAQMPALLKLVSEYAVGSVSTVVFGTFAFMMSALFKNSAFAIGIGVFSVTMGTTVIVMLKQVLNQDWARYILFANADLNSIINGTTPFSGHTLTFAIVNIAVYMVVFLLIAWDAFTRRDVK